MSPAKVGTMRERSTPDLSVKVLVMHKKAFPPRLMAAPVRKSSCPPVPLICLVPEDSEHTCPYRSTDTQPFMDTMLSFWAITAGSFTYERGAVMTPGLSSTQS